MGDNHVTPSRGGLEQVVCVCVGIGFPRGMAQTRRIRMVGRAAIAGGLKFLVLHIGGSHTVNSQNKGVQEGIHYEYLPGQLTVPTNGFVRKFLYLCGAVLALVRIWRLHRASRGVCVYAWVGRGPFGIFFKGMLRLLGVPVLQEVNEWWPGRGEWVRNAISLALTRGSLVISKGIEDRLQGLCNRLYLNNLLLRVPALADAAEMEKFPLNGQSHPPYLLWCGSIVSYLRDVMFMLEALGLVARTGRRCSLVLAGTTSPEVQRAIHDYLERVALPYERVRLTGYVSEAELRQLMAHARGLLLPLWDDDRSRCRFPNKLGEYLFSGRAVITSGVGDLKELLLDGVSALLYPPGDVAAFAQKICQVLDDPAHAEVIGSMGRQTAENLLDWRGNSEAICNHFRAVASAR